MSTFQVMADPDLKCSLCKMKYAKRNDDTQKRHQERKGCFGVSPNELLRYRGHKNSAMFSASQIIYKTCPAHFYSGFWASVINAENMFRSGVMPFGGSLFEQPSKIVEAFNLIHNLKEELNTIREEAAEKYGKRGKR